MTAVRDPVRVAVLGLGVMGRGHLEVLSRLAPWVVVGALADVSADALAAAAGSLPGVPAYDDPLGCIARADVDAVLVASSDSSHAALVLACLDRGLPVLCEKPMTTSAQEAAEIVRREQGLGRRLVHVGFMRRFDPHYRALRQVLQAGEVGEPMVLTQRHHNPSGAVPPTAETLLTSSATHDIDVTRWLLGEVTDVRCDLVDAGSAVALRLTMRTASGALSVSDLGSGPGLTYDVDAELVGSTGVLRTGAPGTVTRAVGERAAAYPPSDWLTRFDAAYLAQAVAWLRSLRIAERTEAGGTGPAGARDGWANAVVVEAALAALPPARRS